MAIARSVEQWKQQTTHCRNYRLSTTTTITTHYRLSWGLKHQWRTTHLPTSYSIFKQRHSPYFFLFFYITASVGFRSLPNYPTRVSCFFLANLIPDVLVSHFCIWLRFCIRGMCHSRSAFHFWVFFWILLLFWSSGFCLILCSAMDSFSWSVWILQVLSGIFNGGFGGNQPRPGRIYRHAIFFNYFVVE